MLPSKHRGTHLDMFYNNAKCDLYIGTGAGKKLMHDIGQAIINDSGPNDDELKRFLSLIVQLQLCRVNLGKLLPLDNLLLLDMLYFLLGMPSNKSDSETTAKVEADEFEKLYYDFLDGKIPYDNFIPKAKELVRIISENTEDAWDSDFN